MLRWTAFILGWLVLTLTEFFYIFLTSPFPGSQEMTNTVELAYTIHLVLPYLRIVCWILMAIPLYHFLRRGKLWRKIVVVLMVGVYGYIGYMMNYPYAADTMFKVPENKVFLPAAENKVSTDRVVMGLNINGQARAYPVEVMGYHHQVYDTIGGEAVIVTYCIVCRTGRVFSPVVNGKAEKFRLVGMTQFNAMLEDNTTGSWWMQATGEAVTGPMKGKWLDEIPFEQVTLASWMLAHPNTTVLQPDSVYSKKYERLEGFDRGHLQDSRLLFTDSSSWEDKSWVIGVVVAGQSRAYDWIELKQQRIVNDTLAGKPIVITLEPDTISFNVQDAVTGEAIQAYQEYWHSWKTFHPSTSRYEP